MIFIIGLGRSGTSLLQSILNAHSKIAFLPETHFLRKYVFNSKFDDLADEKIIDILENDHHFGRTNIVAKELFLGLREHKKSKELFVRMANIYLHKKGKNIIGEKDPRNLDYLEKIVHLFPQSKFIYIRRDPRDIVASRLKAGWSSSYPFIFHPLIINAQYKFAKKSIQKIDPNLFFELNFEDLIKDPQKMIKTICRFAEVEYEKNMLNFSQSSKELVAENEMQWKKETFQPIMKTNFNKWEKQLSANQNFITQVICKDIFKDGYYHKKRIPVHFSIKILKPFFILLSIFVSRLYPVRIFINK